MSHKRAPNGHRIELWADGFYHVYCGGSCLDEVLSKTAAIELAWTHTCEALAGSVLHTAEPPQGPGQGTAYLSGSAANATTARAS